MVSVSRVCEVGGPLVSQRSEADTAPSPGWWSGSQSCSLSRGTPSLSHPVSCPQLRPRCAASPHVVVPARGSRELSPLCGTVDWSCCGVGFASLFSAAVLFLGTFHIQE